jgi:hypothetical protein
MNRSGKQSISINRISHRIGYSRGKLFGIIIIGALLAFELFNYSTTDFALNDLLGGLRFLGIRWATILAIAFCGIDFAGIARLFTPQQGAGEIKEVWYLFGAWLLAATMNAMLTWWGVALAIVNHQSLGSSVIDREILINIVPIFVAIMVWLIRVLIIGTFSTAGDRLFSQSETARLPRPASTSYAADTAIKSSQPQPVTFHPTPKSQSESDHRSIGRPEPTYHPAGMSGYKASNNTARQ